MATPEPKRKRLASEADSDTESCGSLDMFTNKDSIPDDDDDGTESDEYVTEDEGLQCSFSSKNAVEFLPIEDTDDDTKCADDVVEYCDVLSSDGDASDAMPASEEVMSMVATCMLSFIPITYYPNSYIVTVCNDTSKSMVLLDNHVDANRLYEMLTKGKGIDDQVTITAVPNIN